MSLAGIRAWYEGREPREQRVLLIGAVLVPVIVCIALLLPLHRSVAQARERIEGRQQDLEWMRRVAPALAAAGPAPVVPENQESLVVLIDRSARESGLGQSLTGSQPGAGGTLRIQLEKADFNTLIAWLARLVNQHGLRVESATADALAEAGLVNATVVIRSRS